MILLAESANRTKQGGQELIGGLDVRVNRNHFGRQVESFVADLNLPFLQDVSFCSDITNPPFQGIFIRAPIVEKVLSYVEGKQVAEEGRKETVTAPPRRVQDPEAQKALSKAVQVLGTLPGRSKLVKSVPSSLDAEAEAGDIIAVRQGNVFGTSFHPELTSDIRIHVWWLVQLIESAKELGKNSGPQIVDTNGEQQM